MSLEATLGALSTAEKIDAMNILWRDLTENAASFPSPSGMAMCWRIDSQTLPQTRSFHSMLQSGTSGKD